MSEEHPFGPPTPETNVKPVYHDPIAEYRPRGRYAYKQVGTGYIRTDYQAEYEKELAMTPSPDRVIPSPHVMTVYDCIVAVSRDLAQEGISKSRSNQQQNYKFRGIDDVLNALSPLLAKYRLVILPRILSRAVVERATQKGGVLFYVTVEAEFDFVSAADGSMHTVKTYGEAMDSADKATNKAMSAAYKYAAFQTFCIPTEGDNDADAVTHDVQPVWKGPLPKATKPAPMAVQPQSDDGPNLGTADPDDLPDGFHLITDYKLDGDWHKVTWGQDAQGGARTYKTKIAKIGLAAKTAYDNGEPVKVQSKKYPYLDGVEGLGITREQIAGSKFQYVEDEAF